MIDSGTFYDVARLHGPGDIRVASEPADTPGTGEVLLQVKAVGLCGSDLHWYEEASIGDDRLSRPLILGHEFMAVIAAGPRAGERVVADPANNCCRCNPCLQGRTNLCLEGRFAGHGTTDGALRALMPWPERLLCPIPDSIPDDEAALIEPLGVALHALDLGLVAPNDRVGVYGCGPIGLLLIQLLHMRGAGTVIATDCLEHRVSAAMALGATAAFLVDKQLVANMSEPRLLAREQPVDVAIEVSGSDEALSDAIAAVRPGGRVVIVGIPAGDRTAFEAAAARRKEIAISLCRRMVPTDLLRAVRIASSGLVRLSPLISHRYPLERAAEAFATLVSRSGVKVIINPSDRKVA